MNNADNRTAREVLSYLGSLPKLLHDEGSEAAGKVAVQLGNLLLWIHPDIAPGEAKIEQPLDEHPQTVWALGKQFREVGLKLWDNPKQKDNLGHRLAVLEDRFNELLYWQSLEAKDDCPIPRSQPTIKVPKMPGDIF